jgi:hypothetical protein
LSLEVVGLEMIPVEQVEKTTARTGYYWKLNTSTLQEEDFPQDFADACRDILVSKTQNPLQTGKWWQLEAKPALRLFRLIKRLWSKKIPV